MIEIIEPLAQHPGVRVAALVTHDGMPVAIPGRDLGPDEGVGGDPEVPFTDGEALSALSVGLLDELGRGMNLISGGVPERVVLKAARGTLIMQQAAGAVLVVVLKDGLNPEDLRLPMDGAAARIQRSLRSMRAETPAEPPLPRRSEPTRVPLDDPTLSPDSLT